jgi:hypothetical protein
MRLHDLVAGLVILPGISLFGTTVNGAVIAPFAYLSRTVELFSPPAAIRLECSA